jgi:hypothetical protein
MECVSAPAENGEKTETQSEALRKSHCNDPKELGHSGIGL